MKEYKKLWSSVLEKAIQDLQLQPGTRDYRLIYPSAVQWFENTEDQGIGSFIWICNLFEYDPDKIRSKILHNNSIETDRQQRAAGVR